jgi:hypothetical protein
VAYAERPDRQRLDALGGGLRLGWIERKTRPGRADLPSVVADERISGEHHTVLADQNGLAPIRRTDSLGRLG